MQRPVAAEPGIRRDLVVMNGIHLKNCGVGPDRLIWLPKSSSRQAVGRLGVASHPGGAAIGLCDDHSNKYVLIGSLTFGHQRRLPH